jgi:hypothetical protein
MTAVTAETDSTAQLRAVTSPPRKPFHDLGAEYLDRRIDPERETRRLVAKLEKLTLAPAA